MKFAQQGGFSPEVWDQPILQDYLQEGGAFGWVGNTARTNKSDKVLEDIMRSYRVSNKKIAEFLISMDGRHIADDTTFADGSIPELMILITADLRGYGWIKGGPAATQKKQASEIRGRSR